MANENPSGESGAAVLDAIYATIEARRGADPATSYSAASLAGGTPQLARKLGEEAVETVVAALAGNRGEVIAESADLLFHLLLLWADAGIAPAEVFAELERRRGVSGHDEKAARGG